MTLYGWDASHYDGLLSTAILARARDEGIAFFTHKIGEGTSYDDPNDRTALAAAREARVEFIGGYHVVRSGSVAPQVASCIRLADKDEPWWRTFPGWFWQVDLERWPQDNVSASTGIAFGKELRRQTGRLVVLYASRGQYGNELTDWDGPLWNADYGGTKAGAFEARYPGEGGRGWTTYSGKTPTFWQYTSLATIAGLTTCDANAFRGSREQLRALITGGNDMGTWDEKISSPSLNFDAPAAEWLKDAVEKGRINAANTAAILAKLNQGTPPVPVALSDLDRAAIVSDVTAGLIKVLGPALPDLIRGVIRDELNKTHLAG